MRNFSIEELCKTTTGLENKPDSLVVKNLTWLIDNVLDPLRDKYNKPIKINSGYRCKAVNEAVGGKSNSQHCVGCAADITGGSKEENIKLFNLIKESGKYDQLINEYDYKWVHVSYTNFKNRKQELIIK